MVLKEAYKLTPKETFSKLKTTEQGLSTIEAKKRLKKFGPNQLEEKKKISPLYILASQFKDPLVSILIIAVIFSFIIEQYLEAIVILILLSINAFLGFRQEYKAEKAIEFLRKLITSKTRILRDGKEKLVLSKDIVPGDILIVEAGSKIPADARLFYEVKLEMNEASLTGESTPVKKSTQPINKDVIVAEKQNMIFSGTIVSQGKGKAIVESTSHDTEIGKIATLVQKLKSSPTPLQRRMKRFSQGMGIFIGLIVLIVFILGLLAGKMDIYFLFLVALSLAVSAAPEGLPTVITICLDAGIRRMVKKKALIKRLKSVETLGSVTVICTDKTGTITKNEMTVTRIFNNSQDIEVTEEGFKVNNKKVPFKNAEFLLKGALNCNDATMDLGDPTEVALIKLANKAGYSVKVEAIDEIPFSSENKFMATILKNGVSYMKGAPEVVLSKCKYIIIDGEKRMLTKKDKEAILAKNNEMARDSLRVLGFAYSKRKLKDLAFVGLAGMIDPPRENVHRAIKLCKNAGIKVIMITGDHKITAKAIAKDVGITGKIMTGTELDELDDNNLRKIIRDHGIFARTTSEHKVRILKALQASGEIVAMSGDGINDAPALKKADVGVAMNIRGTDVSKDVSDIILLDDNFATIVSAVKEGRVIYNNIQKFIKFLLSVNLDELLLLLTAIILGLPLPLLPLQILWINLVTEGFPAIALAVEPPEKDIMKRKPRNPKESIFYGIKFFLGVATLLAFGTTFLIYYLTLKSGASNAKITTLTMAGVVMFELFLVFTCRSEHPLFKINLFNNRKLIYGVLAGLTGLLVVIYTPLSSVFGTVALGLYDWIKIIVISSIGLIFFEVYKTIKWYWKK